MTSPLNIPQGLSDGWTKSLVPVATTDLNESLLDVFFNHFHPGHPNLPPKRHLLKYVQQDPSPYHFLLSVIGFCGGLYTRDSRLNDLREAAYSAACAPLPFTVQSVQGLYLLAVIAFGETKFSHHFGFANRARAMAIELGMHRKAFAEHAFDMVLAESYRRTWWYIKTMSVLRYINEVEPSFEANIEDVESDTEMPSSEEWEYQSGVSHTQVIASV